MICASKKKNVVPQAPPTEPQAEPAIVVDNGPIQVLNDKLSDLLGDGSATATDVSALSAKLDKLIAYLEKWCQVGNISMDDIREHLS